MLTLGLYWPYWVYRTYRDIRGHAPDATAITPGKACGYLFVPLFNIYWGCRLADPALYGLAEDLLSWFRDVASFAFLSFLDGAG
ncbi:hypothetical protein ACFL5A_04880, partial [Gemmatimonadota bacterium]